MKKEFEKNNKQALMWLLFCWVALIYTNVHSHLQIQSMINA